MKTFHFLKSKLFALFILTLCSVGLSAQTTNYYWTGNTADGEWTTAGNWLEETSLGVYSPTLVYPGETGNIFTNNDVAIFDGVAVTISGLTCQINSSINLRRIRLDAFSGGVVTQNSPVRLRGVSSVPDPSRGELLIQSGRFENEGSLQLDFGRLLLSGGTWNSGSSAKVTFLGSSVLGSIQHLIINNTTANNLEFNDLTMDVAGSGIQDWEFKSDFYVLGTFEIEGGVTRVTLNGERGHLQGDINMAGSTGYLTSTGSTMTDPGFDIDGTVSQNYFGDNRMHRSHLPNVRVACSVLNVRDIFSIRKSWTYQSGVINSVPTGNHPEGAVFAFVGFCNVGGVNHTLQNIAFLCDGSVDELRMDANLEITVPGNFILDQNNANNTATRSASQGYILTRGKLFVGGDLFLNNPASEPSNHPTGGTTNIILTGSNEQYINSTVEEERCRIPFLTIDKADGDVYINGTATVIHELNFAATNTAKIITNHDNAGNQNFNPITSSTYGNYAFLPTGLVNSSSAIDHVSTSLNLSAVSPTTLSDAQAQYESIDNMFVISNGWHGTGQYLSATGIPTYTPILMTGFPDHGHVVGVVKKNGRMQGGDITFPVGSATAAHGIQTSIMGYFESFMVQYFENPNFDGAIAGAGEDATLDGHSNCQYWIANRATVLNSWGGGTITPVYVFNPANVDVTLLWNTNSCTPVNEECLLRVARYDNAGGSNLWTSEGRSTVTGDFATIASSVTSLSPFTGAPLVSDFGPFTFGVAVPLTLSTVVTDVDCALGNNGSIEVQPTGGTGPYLYSSDGGVTFQSSPIFAGLTAGSYTIVVTDDFGCSTSIVVEVTEDQSNCCPLIAAAGSVYVNVIDDDLAGALIISSDYNMPAKAYITQTITVTSGATLDVTNSDVIFLNGAGIIFQDGILRSSNSTYRPCGLNDTWLGLDFQANSSGVINENVFKNAIIAIHDQTESGNALIDYLEVANNDFYNNEGGVRINSGADQSESNYSGNTFITNDNFPFTGGAIAVSLVQTNLSGIITQNDFVNSETGGATIFGIICNQSSAEISNNNFTNMRHALTAINSDMVVFENNRIEVELTFTGDQNQIAVGFSENIWITGNEIITSLANAGANKNAIRFNSVNAFNIKANKTYGFDRGIVVTNSINGAIGENEIQVTNDVGIDLRNVTSLSVNCNQINMSFNPNANNIGIQLVNSLSDPLNIGIRSNCITEANTSIRVSTSVLASLPSITNNFLYNYTSYGLFNDNFTGPLSFVSVPYAQAGRNTFSSNHAAIADIAISGTTAPMTSMANYGVTLTSVGVNIIGNNDYNSSASCAFQVTGNDNLILLEDACDQYEKILAPMLTVVNNKNTLSSTWTERLSSMGMESQYKHLKWLLYLFEEDATVKAQIQQQAQQRLNGNFLKWFEYHNEVVNHTYLAANTSLSAIQTNSDDEQSLLELELLLNAARLQPSMTLSATDIIVLNNIVQLDGRYRNMARVLLRSETNDSDVVFDEMELTAQDQINEVIRWEEERFELYPNPTAGQLTVHYGLGEQEATSYRITDITGRLLRKETLDAKSERFQIDVNKYEPGIYLLSIEAKDGSIKTKRFVKM